MASMHGNVENAVSADEQMGGSRDIPTPAVVVGVDGSQRNKAAVAFAAREANSAGCPLTLLSVLDDTAVQMPHAVVTADGERQWQVLTKLARELTEQYPGLHVRRNVTFGDAVDTLIEQSNAQSLLVVGKRGLGHFGRILVGSTSLEVAGRSRVPVVIVPDAWQQQDHETDPVIVGVDVANPHQAPLGFAFAAARQHGVGLQVVHAIDISPLLAWDPEYGVPAYLRSRAAEGLQPALKPFIEEYPDVAVSVRELQGHPGTVLLDQSEHAQLLVLGRSHRHHLRFSFGSVTRGVLHYAELPVAVVPPA
jgi:nucleotide-binding universal stress UspA family protein